jgi:hypothetical protein
VQRQPGLEEALVLHEPELEKSSRRWLHGRP